MTLVRPLLLPLLGLGLLAMVREDPGGGGGARVEEGTLGEGQKGLIHKGGKGPVPKDGKVERKGGKLGNPGGTEGRTEGGANQGVLGRRKIDEKRTRKKKKQKSKAGNKKVKQSKITKRKMKQNIKRLGGQGNVEKKTKTKQKYNKYYNKKQTIERSKNYANKTQKKEKKKVATEKENGKEAKQACNLAQMVPKFALYSSIILGKASSISKQVGPSKRPSLLLQYFR